MPVLRTTSRVRTGRVCGAALLLLFGVFHMQAQTGTFGIWHGGDLVGRVAVSRTVTGDRTHYVMNSLSSVVLLWSRVITTVCTSEYKGENLVACHTSVHVNGAVRDSSHLRTGRDGTHGYVHPGRTTQSPCTTPWSTTRMYYEEPVHQQTVFVESVLGECPLLRTGEGTYRLTLPDKSVNHYVYRDGVLLEIRVDRSLFDLVFRRV